MFMPIKQLNFGGSCACLASCDKFQILVITFFIASCSPGVFFFLIETRVNDTKTADKDDNIWTWIMPRNVQKAMLNQLYTKTFILKF